MTQEPAESFSIAAVFQNRHNATNKSKHKRCEHCNREGHTIDNCQTLKFYCKYCDKRGHTEDRCRLKNGIGISNNPRAQGNPQHQAPRNTRGSNSYHATTAPDSNKSSQDHSLNNSPGFSDNQLQQLARRLSMMHQTPGNDNAYTNTAGLCNFSDASINSVFAKPWILDSGATDHITSESTLFTHKEPSTISAVNLPTGSSAPITSTGTIPFNQDITLNNVLCVPSFQLNLVSVSKLTAALNCCVLLFPTFCVLQDLVTGKMIGSGKQHDGLYYMSPLQQTPISHQVSQSSNLWHMRLGHPSPFRLKLVSHLLPSKNVLFDNNCTVCPMAKQTRFTFPSSSVLTHALFELLHCDIWGPHKVPTHSGARFFLTIVDDFTRCTWVFFMQHKSETQNLLQSFITFTRTQYHTSVKTVRVDNGTEFLPLKGFFQTHGIEYQRTCVYTPQQNGVVERKHRHLLMVARALLFQSHLPLTFWGESVQTAAYLINRLPSPLLSNKSPFELLHNRPPSLDHLKVFGCLCYATTVHPTHKFDARAKRCIFVGYPPGQKGYKLYNMET